jgi:FAD/FMN-containing dehydrogenase
MAAQALIDQVRTAFGPGAVETEAAAIEPWLVDWRRRWHGAAPAILQPRTTAEVAEMVGRARALGVALVPQGGNSSMVGGATPPADGSAVILSLRRLDRIRHLDHDDAVAVVEAGVILQRLHEAATGAGWRFPLTLGSRGNATVGGLVSTNAGGTQVLRHGTMRGLVAGLEAVLPDGSIVDGLSALKKDNRGPDVLGLMVGGEGTLGVVTAAALKLCPAIVARGVAWAGVSSPEVALTMLRRFERATTAIESFEILPAETLAAVLAYLPGARAPLAGEHRWHLLIEAVAEDAAAEPPADLLERLLADAAARGLVEDATIAASEAQAEAFWRLRDSISDAERASGPAVQHDIAVPVAAMPRFMIEAGAACEARFSGTRASGFGHLGDGNVHFHVRAPAGSGPDWTAANAATIMAFVDDLVVAAGGSISAEHGIGQMKLAEFARLGPAPRLAMLRAVKAALDPAGIMNPGKLVPPPTLAPGPNQP